MSDVFGETYASTYDALYQDKDYEAECDLIESIFRRYGDGSMHSILDLGCGTGNHVLPLAQRGYQVVGVDRSGPMLEQARKKAEGLSSQTKAIFHQGDIRDIDLKQSFDAVLIMFAVLGYQLENADILSVFGTVRRHLRSGGILIFDAWYGPSVLTQRPSDRTKVIPTLNGELLRASSGALDNRRQICTVRYHVWQLEGSRLVANSEETHLMRYFFPMELELFLDRSGFELIRLGAFPEFDRDPDDMTWNVLVAARAV